MEIQKVGKIEFEPKILLGEGSFGSVYLGMYKGQKVAVKRVTLSRNTTDEKEEQTLKQLNHPNIIKLFHVESYSIDKYFALELCNASLDKLFLKKDNAEKYKGPKLPWRFVVLLQLASGLNYIHSHNLIHRDVKPENVLIHVDSVQKVTMKWADFGLSKQVNERGTYTMSAVRGTMDWMAPELLLDDEETDIAPVVKRRGSVKSDVFAEGLVFGYFIYDGKHLFGSGRKIENNISENNPVNLANIKSSRVRELLLKMLKGDPGERITSQEVVEQLQSTIRELNKMEAKLFKLLGESAIDLKQVQVLIDEGVDVNCVNQEGMTPFLHLMKGCNSKTNLTETMKLLLENNIDVNSKDRDEWVALHFLCRLYQQEDLIDFIQLLIQHGIVVDSLNNKGENALHLLCANYKKDNITDIIKLLHENGIDVNTMDKSGWNALHLSCFRYHKKNLIDVVGLLVEKGIDLNSKNDFGENALQTLCRDYRYNKWIEIIRLLVEKGIDVNNRNNEDWNALHSLCRAKYNEVNLIEEIQFLIKQGIDVNCANDGGWNALQILCQNYKKENLIDIVHLFIEDGIDLNWKNKKRWNALHFLCKYYCNENLIDIVRILIEKGIAVNHTANEGNALHLLCKYYPNENLFDILHLLISNRITVRWNAVDATILISRNPNQANNERVIQLLNQHI